LYSADRAPLSQKDAVRWRVKNDYSNNPYLRFLGVLNASHRPPGTVKNVEHLCAAADLAIVD
jgi:hypothetical protein